MDKDTDTGSEVGAEPINSLFIRPKNQGNYAKPVLEELSALPPMTPAEVLEAEEKQLELKRSLNENRRRCGEEILFLDV